MVSALIPAFNEQNTIAGVIETLNEAKEVHEVIVVSDGSSDNTAQIAESLGATVVRLSKNMGKGAAIKEGLAKCGGDVILLMDADLIGLKVFHVEKLLAPVLNCECDMAVGVFNRGRFSTDLAHKVSPYLSGQRVVRRYILDGMRNYWNDDYGIEIAMTIYAEKENIPVKEVLLDELTHVMKEEKYGYVRGFRERLKMYWQIYKGFKFARDKC